MQSNSKSSWAFGSREMVLAAIFGAMTLVLGGIGFGFIPIANLSGASTFLHLPVILGAIIGGPIVGMICGFIFGGLALGAFPAFGPLVHIPSRILIGLLTWMVYSALRKGGTKVWLAAAIAAGVGALTNTIFTVGTAVVLVPNLFPASAIPTVFPQAITELIVAVVLIPAIVTAVDAAMRGRQ